METVYGKAHCTGPCPVPLRELRRMMGARGEAASAALGFPPSLVFGGPLGGAAPFQLDVP